MIAVITRYQVREPLTHGARAMVDEISLRMRTASGLRAAYRFEPSPTEALTVTIWESRDQADSALAESGPAVRAALGGNLAGTPQRTYAEVTNAFPAL